MVELGNDMQSWNFQLPVLSVTSFQFPVLTNAMEMEEKGIFPGRGKIMRKNGKVANEINPKNGGRCGSESTF